MVSRVYGWVRPRWEGLTVIAVVLTLGVVFVLFLYTPTRSVTIENNWGATVSVSGCTSDVIIDIPVGDSEIVDAKGKGSDRCVIYSLKPYRYIGCLRLPAGVDVVDVSQVSKSVPENACQS